MRVRGALNSFTPSRLPTSADCGNAVPDAILLTSLQLYLNLKYSYASLISVTHLTGGIPFRLIGESSVLAAWLESWACPSVLRSRDMRYVWTSQAHGKAQSRKPAERSGGRWSPVVS